MKLTMWLKERELNARRLAAGRTGADRAGWLEDADHFQAALTAVEERDRLRAGLRKVAQAHAWLAFGDCRSFGVDVALLSPSDADAAARVALGEYREGPARPWWPHYLMSTRTGDTRPCTCHPDDSPPQPCARLYALTECKADGR